MKTKLTCFLTLVFVLMMQVTFAQDQTKTIKGTVVGEEDGMPLPSVDITIEGTDQGTMTDFDGKYSIEAKVGDVLKFTYLGYETVTQKVSLSNEINVKMSMGSQALDELVIQGAYDITTTKKESMGAVTTVSAETFEDRGTNSFLNSLQGHAPGVNIQSNSGSPGSAQIDVLIRGLGSINASTDPLIVVDGIVIGAAQFRNLNQQDFESVTILRDAHETAPYGNRGANGVIMVTTKKGKAGMAPSIEVSSMTGIMTLPKDHYNMASAQELLQIQKTVNLGFGATLTEDEIANWNGPNTDWRNVFFDKGTSQDYNVSMAQGSENFRSYFSTGYNKVEGMIPTTDFQRFTLRTNLSGNSEDKKFNYEAIVNVAHSKRHELDSETNSGISNNVIQNPLFGAILGMPYLDPYKYANGRELFNDIGGSLGGGNYAYVLKSIMEPGEMPNERAENSILASFSAGYELVDNLVLRNKIGIDYKHSKRTFARAPWSFLAMAVADGAGLEYPGFEFHSNVQDLTLSNVLSLNYEANFGLNKLKFGAYTEYIKAHYLSSSLQQTGLIERTWEFGAGTGWADRDGDNYIPTVSAQKINAGSFSYFGTVNYEYDERYGAAVTVRRDASNKFRKSKQWGTFWSAAARWVLSEEAFMEDVDFVNLLKLRGSYGVTGNQVLSDPGYGGNPYYGSNTLAWDYYTSDAGYLNSVAYYPVVGNIDVGWEETHQANIGLDFRLLNNRLEGNIDVYKKNTKKLFTDINLSALTGQYEINGNNGELENKGVELALRYKVVKSNDFNVTLWANTAYNKNKIVSMPSEDIQPGATTLAEGHMAYEYYMIPFVGVDSETGEWLYKDIDGNIVDYTGIDPERDARFTGKSLVPKWNGGFGVNIDYKGWYLDANFSYQADFAKFDNLRWWLYDAGGVADQNVTADLLNAWTPENPNTNVAALDANNVYDGDSDRMISDASFVRFRSATLGYNFPKEWLEKTFIDNVNVYVQGENLLLWTKWKGYDPEGLTSFRLGQYPNPRLISVGVNVKL